MNTKDNDNIIIDSKKLSAKKRAKALEWIKSNVLAWGVGWAESNEIDSINILNATKLAMDRAIEDLKSKYQNDITDLYYLLIDGTGWEKKFKNYNVESIIKGDSLYYSIAAASIIAKEYHDAHIMELVNNNPELDTKYALSSNKGYPTAKHFDGIKKHGCSEYHRKSFKGVI
jgi:ribonuclease HII